MKVAAVLPIAKLGKSKTRLSAILSPSERVELTFLMAESIIQTLQAASIDTIYLVSPDKKLRKKLDARFVLDDRNNLDAAVAKATFQAVKEGFTAALFAPVDLPLLTREDLEIIISFGRKVDVVVSPSLDGGTSLLWRRPPTVMPTSFMGESFTRHLKIAKKRGLEVEVYRSDTVALDIDTVEDLVQLFLYKGNQQLIDFLEGLGIRLAENGKCLVRS